jgi:2-polyprenyl-3-methyl-5-hydroxy-6-metoxy-1,4-benzoquinol methylase
VDVDAARQSVGRRQAEKRKLAITWLTADLATHDLPAEAFDVVMIFNYLDRRRMPAFRALVKPGGWLLVETFLRTQGQHGWGPTSAEHLLEPGELVTLAAPFEITLAREGTEIAQGRPMDVAGVLAQRPLNADPASPIR